MTNKLIIVKKLWQGSKEEHFAYSNNHAEPIILEYVAQYLNKKVTSITQGYCPSHDGSIGNDLVEIKVQSGWDWEIEYAYADGTSSGINVTRAKNWIIVNQGKNNKFGTVAGKVRMPEVEILKKVVNRKIANGEGQQRPRNENGPGSWYVKINPKTEMGGNDGWLDCDVTIQIVDDGIAYDFGEPLTYGRR